ncbi:hypothetical protein ACFYZJ_34045 [Streptomyces sp. NPDC001848]|uniref:hypothetical protein n=1 Tax=Streptomyces sp. NPDC001848 TaxID=3364618 RepID=UPI003673A7B7
MSATRMLTTAAALALGSVALVGCNGTTSAAGSTPSSSAAAPSPGGSSTASASPATGTPRADASAGGGTTAKGGTGRTATTGGAHHSAPASGSGRTPYCRADRLTVTAAPVSRPLNHLLITARNTSGSPCDLGIIGLVTFDGRIKAATPDGIGGGPTILKPGQANYEGVFLDRQDAPGTGTRTTTLSVRLDGGDTIRIPVQAYVHAPSITVWEPTAADALAS